MIIDDIVGFLVAGGYGVEGSTIFRNFAPSVDLTTITVTPTGGPPDPKFDYDDVTFQIRVRGKDSAAAETKATNVLYALHGFHGGPLVVGGLHIVDLLASAGVTYAGRDASGRDNYTLNFKARVKRPA